MLLRDAGGDILHSAGPELADEAGVQTVGPAKEEPHLPALLLLHL